MKKKLTLLPLLVTLVLSICSFTNIRLLPTVGATYVEGPITQDTVWTLLQSPFVVARDIMVYPNATLTIEPGVEVKFGGAFSLIVSGHLYANGTSKTIVFTSNKVTPRAGDWNAIKFNGNSTSTLIGCSIAYAANGTLVENGNVNIEKSTVDFCQNGVFIANGTAMIQNSTIAQNLDNGLAITGADHVTLENDTVMANGNGILLTGTNVSNVSMRWNKISANKNNGIQIDATNHTGIVITDDVVSSNGVGIYISSPTSTNITGNSISYNNVGLLYDEGNQTATYNDIYNNQMGMNVLSNATVDAEHNYWGDPSGPYHQSLNPQGTGNPVGGNGVNLVFIFFLTKPIGIINTRPTASLVTDKITVQPNESVMFFATDSYDSDGRVVEYLFNFGDGTNSGWITLSICTHRYLHNGTYGVSLTVMDDYGATSTPVTTTVYVKNLPSLYVSVVLNNSTAYAGGDVPITARVTDGANPVQGATVTMFSVAGATFSSGSTNASGYFTATFTAPNVTDVTTVRIVATASKSGYADNSDYEYLQVSPYLSVQIGFSENTVISEGTATIIVHVMSRENPVANASVTVSSDIGNLNPPSGYTDSNGVFPLVFTAPQTTTFVNATITAVATKNNYVSSVEQTQLPIEPKIPVVQITTASNSTLPGAKLSVTVHMEYDTIPLSGSNVTITANNGNLSTTAGLTNTYGNFTFTFTAPLVNRQTNITIAATATKKGYAETQSQLQVTVNPRTLSVQITAPQIGSGESATVSVLVKCREDGTAVAGATVIMSSPTFGNFTETAGTTDQTGTALFTFYAPQTTSQLLIPITANVTKNGYADNANQTTIIVTPETISQTGGGWPLTTILLIVIPIVIAVIVAVLIKLKIIAISLGEEQK